MTAATCPRMFEVEALRDRRLDGAARQSFQRHLDACSVCAGEAAALNRLADQARAGTDDPQTEDDLHIWRERTRLVAAFDRALLSPNRPSRAARLLLWPVAAAALVFAVVVLWRPRPAPEAGHEGRATIHATGGTAWFRRPGPGGREEILLQQGTLWVHVDRAAGECPVRVLLPDGELEDVGTTFTVSADGTETTRVTVEEGKIVLRMRGRASVDLGAGEVWSGVEASRAPVVDPVATATSAPAELPRERQRASAALPARRSASQHQSAVAVTNDPLVAFRAAMAALRAGDNAEAAVAFARFVAEHPGDPMAEDAAYLRVIAFQRMGADTDMRRAAQAYLQRFPSGFRRDEVSRLTR